MAFSFSSFADPTIWFGTGGVGILSFVGGHVRSRNGRVTKLEREVEECRKRDADVEILKAGMRMIVGKVQREQPDSVELKMFNDLCNRRFGPLSEQPADFAELLRRIDEVDAARKVEGQ